MSFIHSVIYLLLLASLLSFEASSNDVSGEEQKFDIVVNHGRVIDPEEQTIRPLHIGITDGFITAISEKALTADIEIDASEQLIAPGFVDLHVHSHHDEAHRLLLQMGVTSAFEIEVGSHDINQWHNTFANQPRINVGVGAGHIAVRQFYFNDPSLTNLPSGDGAFLKASADQMLAMEKLLRKGLDDGAVAVGIGPEYTPGASDAELTMVLKLAQEHNASVHVHLEKGLNGLKRILDINAPIGASLVIVHINSSAGDLLPQYLSTISQYQAKGQRIYVEAYPYNAGMTRAESAKFADYSSWPDSRFKKFQNAETGEWLNRTSFSKLAEEGGIVIHHSRTETQTKQAIISDMTFVASDGFVQNGVAHPRISGTFAKVLSDYVREQSAIDMITAVSKMTVIPANILSQHVPEMALRGRICIGCYADLVVFDPETIDDNATYQNPTAPASGITYVIVNGQVSIANGLITDVKAGKSILSRVTSHATLSYSQ